ncbi:MAG: carotenoid biosynthesis protein, partial [Anaerolineales bacterium]|nr:carotenoid biosynthesis protein [Anaerolineales bacterium]
MNQSPLAAGRALWQRLAADLPLPTWAWLIFTIALPILDYLAHGAQYPALASLGVLLQLSAVVFILGRGWSLRQLIDAVGAAVPLAWAAEWLGSTTGFPFGVYRYTDLLQPQ